VHKEVVLCWSYTDIALAAGSDKTVHVFDINAGQCVRVMTDVHTRAVHHIAQNQVSNVFSLFHSDPSQEVRHCARVPCL